MSKKQAIPNKLIHESSPYLLQHAYNPVQWYPWGGEALERTRKENKLMLVSIGYSACHWCHVMERECFEDEEVAAVMNAHFINIKVDREERPDIDQVYMSAVQLMTRHGGWPLNCFTLPDGKPVFGGTYFPKDRWLNVLHSLKDVFSKEPEKVKEYAQQLTDGIRQMEAPVKLKEAPALKASVLHDSVNEWKKRFDNREGGPAKAPKFPLPNNYLFLLRYTEFLKRTGTKDEEIRSGAVPDPDFISQHIRLTLDKMALGGIYDQAGGGFARYSTDHLWKIPHFEKMLYDNAQLISLYSEAYRKTGEILYRETAEETIRFAERELLSPEGAFRSALDADSEGEEGKFYAWEEEELKELIGPDYPLFSSYYNINFHGAWEGKFILLRREKDGEFAGARKLNLAELQGKVRQWKDLLLGRRSGRVRPGLDDKILCSWNAMMVTGLCDAYRAFGEEKYRMMARKTMQFILDNLYHDGRLMHTWKNGKARVNGFLEDYAFTIEALVALYQCSFDEDYLITANRLCKHCLEQFHDEDSGMFWFTSSEDDPLIARKAELSDNVIPSSNSVMAMNLFMLSHYFAETKYREMSLEMLKNIQHEIRAYGAGWSNWMMLQLCFLQPVRELVIVGNSVEEIGIRLRKGPSSNLIFAGSRGQGQLPLLKDRQVEGKTLIYVCTDGTCELPTEDADDVYRKVHQ